MCREVRAFKMRRDTPFDRRVYVIISTKLHNARNDVIGNIDLEHSILFYISHFA